MDNPETLATLGTQEIRQRPIQRHWQHWAHKKHDKDNPETLATLGTQETRQRQSRDTDNI